MQIFMFILLALRAALTARTDRSIVEIPYLGREVVYHALNQQGFCLNANLKQMTGEEGEYSLVLVNGTHSFLLADINSAKGEITAKNDSTKHISFTVSPKVICIYKVPDSIIGSRILVARNQPRNDVPSVIYLLSITRRKNAREPAFEYVLNEMDKMGEWMRPFEPVLRAPN